MHTFVHPLTRLIACLILCVATVSQAAEGESAVGPLMNLLKSGRLPQERLGSVVELVCQRGNAHDLAYVYSQALGPEGYTGELRLKALQCLADAARTRKVVPEEDLSGIAGLISPAEEGDGAAVRLAAIRLAGLWKVEAAAERLREIATAESGDPKLQQAAIDALLDIGGDAGRATFEALTGKEHPQRVRYLGVAALAQMDLDAAAPLAAQVLSDATGEDDPTAMIDAFLQRQTGADALAAAIEKAPPSRDVARIVLRHMYSVGRSDASLVDRLSEVAEIDPNPEPPTPEEVKQLVAEVIEHGDPQRGEEIFRRADVSCMKCHAVSKAGGDIGPDLSAVGSSSPVDYIVNSILQPSQAIKEIYVTKVVLTLDGKVYHGIVASRDENRLVLKDAAGKLVEIPTADIDLEEEGKSLMPVGLTQFLTREELVDLVRFLSELGKPGPYAIRSTPTIQRWRVLSDPSEELTAAVPSDGQFVTDVLESDASRWTAAYARVAGMLPLGELARQTKSDVLYIRGEVDVTEPGPVGVRLSSADGVHVWVNDVPYGSQGTLTATLPAGRHEVTLRVDTTQRSDDEIRAELFRPEGAAAEFTVVDGR